MSAYLDFSPMMAAFLEQQRSQLEEVMLDHPEDERLAELEANLRAMIGFCWTPPDTPVRDRDMPDTLR